MMPRSQWQWLVDLVAQQATREATAPRAEPPRARPALRDALAGLGWGSDALAEGLALALEVTPVDLRRPPVAAIAHVDPSRLAVVLWLLLEHGPPPLREIAEAWLGCRGVAYQLPPATLEHWLAHHTRASLLLRPRLPQEGLAWLGPDALRRLAQSAADQGTRQAAAQWVARIA